MLATFVLALAGLVLVVGWLGGVMRLVYLAPGLAAMVPSTAMCFILLSGALVAWKRFAARRAALAASALVVLITLADLAIVAGGTQGGIDLVAMPFLADRLAGSSMSVATAVDQLLAAVCVVLLVSQGRLARLLFTPLATTGLAIAAVALVGYAFDVSALRSVFAFSAIGLHTALLLAILFVALKMAWHRGWMGLLFGPGIGSAGARRLVPVLVAGPLVLCFVILLAIQAGHIEANFGIALLAVSMVGLGIAAESRNAVLQNRSQAHLGTTLDTLRRTVADRDLLIRETHHRVKNNLQQITALIAIEAAKHRDLGRRAPFDALSGRVQALGLVHQLLMQGARPSEIDIRQFVNDLCDSLSRSYYLIKRNIRLEPDVDAEEIPLDVAVTLGLLVNELVVNAIKHAFAPEEGGIIQVTYGNDPEVAEAKRLVVTDDGEGLDVDAVRASEGGGTRIIRSLAAQLRGQMDVSVESGTRVSISFPASTYIENRYVG